MRIAVLLVLAGACGRGEPDRAPARRSPWQLDLPPRVRAAPGDAGAAVLAPDAAAPTIASELDTIAAGNEPSRVCFAVSANHRRAACALGTWRYEMGADDSIEIVGDVGDAESQWIYFHYEGYSATVRGWDPPSDPAALAAARTALAERKYAPNTAPEVALDDGATATAGAFTVRRTRVHLEHEGCPPWNPEDTDAEPCPGGWEAYRERLELRCGSTWREIANDYADQDRYGTPTITISALTDRYLLIVLDTSWTIEGEFGGARIAKLFDAAAFCH